MKKWAAIVIGVILLLVQVLNVYFTFNIYQEINNNQNRVMNEENSKQQIRNELPVMNLQESAEYLRIQEEQLRRLIVTEKNIIEIRGNITDEMLPYIQIDDNYYFSKVSLDEWIYEISKQKTSYDTNKYEKSF